MALSVVALLPVARGVRSSTVFARNLASVSKPAKPEEVYGPDQETAVVAEVFDVFRAGVERRHSISSLSSGGLHTVGFDEPTDFHFEGRIGQVYLTSPTRKVLVAGFTGSRRDRGN